MVDSYRVLVIDNGLLVRIIYQCFSREQKFEGMGYSMGKFWWKYRKKGINKGVLCYDEDKVEVKSFKK